jgi:hypothetical protein
MKMKALVHTQLRRKSHTTNPAVAAHTVGVQRARLLAACYGSHTGSSSLVTLWFLFAALERRFYLLREALHRLEDFVLTQAAEMKG